MSVISDINSFENVKQVNDGFYVGQIPDKDLRIVMERLDATNRESWHRYAEIQTFSRVHDMVMERRDENGQPFQRGSLIDGSGHFKQVLETISDDVSEVWVAYITKEKNPGRIPDMTSYSGENALEGSHPFAKNIEIFVTITSSPEALVTSHMGVACSLESVGNRSKGTSLDLHSFAAKIMLLNNPRRKYMVHAPADAMEMIIAKALPDAFHAGTVEMREKMKKRQNITLEEFQNDILTKKSKKIKKLAEINSEDPRVQKAIRMTEIFDYEKIEDKYQRYRNPHKFKSAKDINAQAKEFLKFMENHPPILSVKEDRMIILNPKTSEPEITIERGNKKYQWFDKGVFKPVGSTHYTVVDLPALAASRELGSIF